MEDEKISRQDFLEQETLSLCLVLAKVEKTSNRPTEQLIQLMLIAKLQEIVEKK